MWKRDEAVRPAGQAAGTTGPPQTTTPAAAPAPASARSDEARPTRDMVNIGKSVVIKGELNGSEDLTVEGHVEGKIELRDNVLTIGPTGRIQAEIHAKSVAVFG